jgi:hypothetical protein
MTVCEVISLQRSNNLDPRSVNENLRCSNDQESLTKQPTRSLWLRVLVVHAYHVRGMVRAHTCARECVRLSRAPGRHAPLIISLITGTSHRGGAPASVSTNDSVQAVRSKRGCPLDEAPPRGAFAET